MGQNRYFEGKKVLICRIGFHDGGISAHPIFENFPGVSVGGRLPLPSGGESTKVIEISLSDEPPEILFVRTESKAVYMVIPSF